MTTRSGRIARIAAGALAAITGAFLMVVGGPAASAGVKLGSDGYGYMSMRSVATSSSPGRTMTSPPPHTATATTTPPTVTVTTTAPPETVTVTTKPPDVTVTSTAPPETVTVTTKPPDVTVTSTAPPGTVTEQDTITVTRTVTETVESTIEVEGVSSQLPPTSTRAASSTPIQVMSESTHIDPAPSAGANTGQGWGALPYLLFGGGVVLMLTSLKIRRGNAH